MLVNAEVKFIARVKCTARAELVAPMKRPVILFSDLDERAMRQNASAIPIWIVSLMNVLDELSFVTTMHGKRILEPANLFRHELCPVRSRHNTSKLTKNAQAAPPPVQAVGRALPLKWAPSVCHERWPAARTPRG